MLYSEPMAKKKTIAPAVRPAIQVPQETHDLVRKLAVMLAKEKGLESLSMAQTVGIVAREAIEARRKQ